MPPPLADHLRPTVLGLVHRNVLVTVGSDPADAMRLYRNSQAGFESERLPPHFAPPYQALVWDGTDESFGTLSFDNKLVLAMHQISNASKADVDQVLQDYTKRLAGIPRSVVEGKKVTYWFWEDQGQRLMICAVQQTNGKALLCEAVGEDSVMDALRMDGNDALDDRSRADTLLSKRELGQNAAAGEKP